MQNKKTIDVLSLFKEVLGERINDFKLPPPSFELMRCEIVDYNIQEQSLTIKVPVLEDWQNPFGTMQGGLIVGAIDNAVGPLSMLLAGANMTRSIETKYLKAITMDVQQVFVTAKLLEQKKRRLLFDVEVKDALGVLYTQAKVVNFVIKEK
jgi:acyl-coenzyme A thioesterase PaaI-like protein